MVKEARAQSEREQGAKNENKKKTSEKLKSDKGNAEHICRDISSSSMRCVRHVREQF